MSLRACIGRKALRWLRIFRHQRECLRDGRLYLDASTALGYRSGHEAAQKESELTRYYHSLEKGLCMPDFKPRSGEAAVRGLQRLLADGALVKCLDPGQVEAARAVLDTYCKRHESRGVDVSDLFPDDVPSSSGSGGGAGLGAGE